MVINIPHSMSMWFGNFNFIWSEFHCCQMWLSKDELYREKVIIAKSGSLLLFDCRNF